MVSVKRLENKKRKIDCIAADRRLKICRRLCTQYDSKTVLSYDLLSIFVIPYTEKRLCF